MAEMTLEQKKAVAMAKARMLAAQAPVDAMNQEKPSTAMDMLKSAGSGVAQGALDLVGLPGTIQNAFDNSVSAITGVTAPPPSQLSGEELRKTASGLTNGATNYQPQTTAGEFAHTAGEFVPGAVALGGGGGLVSNAVKLGIVPGVASEAAGQVAQEYAPAVEPYARVAGALAGGSIAPAARAMVPKAEEAALAEIAKAAKADALTPQMMQQRLDELGPQGMVADLGPNFQGQAGAIANMDGPGNKVIRSALDGRNTGANDRLAATMDQTIGPRVVPSEIKAQVDEGQRLVGQQYQPIMENATRVDTQPLADRLDANMVNLRGPERQAVREVRGYLDIPGTDVLDPSPRALHSTREAIDGRMATEQNPKVAGALTDARQEVDRVLAQAAPNIKEVDAQYHELARQAGGRGGPIGGALQEGQRLLDSGRTAPRPEDVAQMVVDGVQPQGRLMGPSAATFRLTQGARADIDRIVGNNKNDIAAVNQLIKGEGDWNRQKLVSLFGQDRTDQLFRVLENEKAFADTRNFAVGNSLSANRLQYQKSLGGSDSRMSIPEYYGAGGVLGALRGAGIKVAGKALSGVLDKRSSARNAELAKNLTGRQSVVDALIQGQTRGRQLTAPVKQALVQALLDQKRRLEGQ